MSGNRWTNYMLGGAADKLRSAIVKNARASGKKLSIPKRAAAEWISCGAKPSEVRRS